METNKHKKLQKSRSSQACIREGYRFYMSHFRRIFRTTWPIAIVFAVITAATSAMPVIISPDLLIPAIAIETVAVVLLLYIVGKRLRKRGVMEQTGPLKLQSWLRHLGMILIVTIVCIFVISALTLFTSLPTFIMMAANWQSKMGVCGHARLCVVAIDRRIPHRWVHSGLYLDDSTRPRLSDERLHCPTRKRTQGILQKD